MQTEGREREGLRRETLERFRRGGELTAMGFMGPLSKFLVAPAQTLFQALSFRDAC